MFARRAGCRQRFGHSHRRRRRIRCRRQRHRVGARARHGSCRRHDRNRDCSSCTAAPALSDVHHPHTPFHPARRDAPSRPPTLREAPYAWIAGPRYGAIAHLHLDQDCLPNPRIHLPLERSGCTGGKPASRRAHALSSRHTYARRGIGRLLDALADGAAPDDFDIVVVFNGSSEPPQTEHSVM